MLLEASYQGFLCLEALPPEVKLPDGSGPSKSIEDSVARKLPVEITDFNAATQYINDLKLGSVGTYRCKTMLIGSPGVGKTSLASAWNPLAASFLEGTVLYLYGPNLYIAKEGKMTRLMLNHTYFIKRIKNKIEVLCAIADAHSVTVKYHSSYIAPFQPSNMEISSVNLEISFDDKDETLCDLWYKNLHQWFGSTSTVGVELFKREYEQEGNPPLQLTFMDFSGQQEYDENQ
jgi:GTPase SAR1 family protein